MARKPKDNGIGHNGPDAVTFEKNYIAFIAQFREHRATISEAMAALKALRKRFKSVRDNAKNAGFPLAIFDRILDDLDKGGRADLERDAALERWMREKAGAPTGDQLDLFSDPAPRDKDWWWHTGYQAGLMDLAREAPENCPPDHMQDWLKGHVAGKEKLAWALAEDVNPEAPKGAGGTTAAEIKREPEPAAEPEDYEKAMALAPVEVDPDLQPA